MQDKDVAEVTVLLNNYLSKTKLYFTFSEDEVKHFFVPRENVIYTYVIENSGTKKITDFMSFYSLPSSILKHVEHRTLYVAYCYYNVATTVSLTVLMKDALILAKNIGFDVFNALDI
jgi:glycylpeptide N-tetradecanoyltransferase